MALTTKQVARLREAGRYHDARGLYLQISESGARSWLLRFERDGRERMMGLGSAHDFSLEQARERASAARRLLADNVDPIEHRKADRLKRRLDDAKAVSFKECAERYIRSHGAGWRNAKHASQWTSTLATYVYPVMGTFPVSTIDTAIVLKVLEPIWTAKPETAARVRGRVEAVLNWATAREHRQGDNPARWRGHLEKLLPLRAKVRKVEHHAALPYTNLPGFLVELRKREGIGARALEFAILTAARTGEVVGARWDEIDLVTRVWTIPAERMKAGREHRVPLSERAIQILKALPTESEFVFVGSHTHASISNAALLNLLQGMGRTDITVHGFRSTFRNWAAEQTSFPREVAELALAHAIGDAVERAYQRTTLFDKRRKLMDAWSTYCTTPAPKGEVVSIASRSRR
jgi:integrase